MRKQGQSENTKRMDSVGQIIDTTMVLDEVFVEIFRYLPLQDRKSIRLTCHRFYKLCDDPLIQAGEVFILHGNAITISALHCLSMSTRKIHNIKFDYVNLQIEAIHAFFEQQGTHVRSLVFEGCSFEPRSMKCMIEFCVNLRSIALVRVGPNIVNDFKILDTNSIVCNKVTDLTLDLTNAADLSNRQFLRFFDIFPKIKKLNLNMSLNMANNQCSKIYSDVVSDSPLSFSCICDRLLALANQLEILKLNFGHKFLSKSIEPLINISNIRMKNLKELSLQSIKFSPDISIMPGSLLFEQLTSFHCGIKFESTDALYSVSIFLQHLLKSTPLRSLFLVNYPIPIDRELFQTLVKSKLMNLDLSFVFGDQIDFHPSSLESTLVPNYSLQHFYNIDILGHPLTLLLATYFRNLRHMLFAYVDNNDVIESLLFHLTHIRCLYLADCRDLSSCTEHPCFQQLLQSEGRTIDREFKRLARLAIIGAQYSLTMFLLSEFSFPNLKSLHLDNIHLRDHEIKVEQLWQLIQKLPELEYLCVCLVSPFPINFPQLLALFGNLHKLRHFNLEDYTSVFSRDYSGINSLFTASEYVQLFNLLPSLRSVRHLKNPSGGTALYHYDVTTKTVIDVANQSPSIRNDFRHIFLHTHS
ncbi:hypothetical protein V9T40_005678 [Parthenolecanium corni]|uniref:F-box domain-containing protein n=1 Tax=Parthenolecanium corni TaxID=536013 RepID=A0AAN9TTA9_9HEMI